METIGTFSLLVGILVMLSTYLVLSKTVEVEIPSIKKSLVLFSATLGLLSTFWLRNNPEILGVYSEKIVIGGIGITLALLASARRFKK